MDINFDKNEKEMLIEIAKNAIKLRNPSVVEGFENSISEKLNEEYGVFVSVYVNADLRGCIGRFKSKTPLYKLVALMATQSAFYDTRFEPVNESEFESVLVELSVISPFKQINSIDEFVLGRHGIYIKQGFNTGTFLPQVAKKTGWSAEQFFGHCSRDKAGIGWDGWKSAELFIYTAEVFKG